MLVCVLVFTLDSLQLVLLAEGAPFGAIAVAASIAGFAFAFGSVIYETALQRQIAPEKLSRVASFDWLVAMSVLPIGYALAGPIADAIGIVDLSLDRRDLGRRQRDRGRARAERARPADGRRARGPHPPIGLDRFAIGREGMSRPGRRSRAARYQAVARARTRTVDADGSIRRSRWSLTMPPLRPGSTSRAVGARGGRAGPSPRSAIASSCPAVPAVNGARQLVPRRAVDDVVRVHLRDALGGPGQERAAVLDPDAELAARESGSSPG